MNTILDYRPNHIKTHLDHVEVGTRSLKALTSAAKKVFESAEHAARITVVVLMMSLVIISATNVLEAQRVTAHYNNAISEIVVPW